MFTVHTKTKKFKSTQLRFSCIRGKEVMLAKVVGKRRKPTEEMTEDNYYMKMRDIERRG